MKIAFVSYEYPPDTAVGGIATYVHQAAKLLRHRGHTVEVFCSSYSRNVSEIMDEVYVHRINCEDRNAFADNILPVFAERHTLIQFDIIESPEFSADGLSIKKKYPALPMVVKLHTPQFLVNDLNKYHSKKKYISDTKKKARYILGALRRGKSVKPYWRYYKENDREYNIAAIADEIHTPSISLGDIVAEKWHISRKHIYNVPYPYTPSSELLKIDPDNQNKVITYIGRLEIRKGVINLTKAISIVLKKHPEITVRFIGKNVITRDHGDMKQYILNRLRSFKSNIEFREVSLTQIPTVLAETDICIFPSLWENFPNVCLEAMSAARGIVASKNGGMKDMLEPTEAGILIDPDKPLQLADAIIKLIEKNDLRITLGKAARKRVLSAYNGEVIGELMEMRYAEAITKSTCGS